jgi:hypothetical protein
MLIIVAFCAKIAIAKISEVALCAFSEVSFYNTFLRKQPSVVPLPGAVFLYPFFY